MEFDVRLYQDEDEMWIVECPAIPGCVSQGKSEAEAMENIQDAIRLCLEARKAHGMPPVVQHRTVRLSA
jgi:predicted RNase H-like HicB family nuclease